MTRRYYKVMPDRGMDMLSQFLDGGFVAVDFEVKSDLTGKFTESFSDFNKQINPIIRQYKPDITKVGAGLAAGCIWRIGRGISQGDIVLCPNKDGELHIGEVSGDYFYLGDKFPHRRKIVWRPNRIKRSDCSQELQNGLKSGLTVYCVDPYGVEIEQLIAGHNPQVNLQTNDLTIENPSVFALEKYLEEFLITNWDKTELSNNYSILSEDGEIVGRQYETDTGRIDILAISKDSKTLLVIELKKGRASDVVVGQIQRYMGFVTEELAGPEQQVRGLIIALENDDRIKRALVVAKGIDFYRYEVNFRLIPINF